MADITISITIPDAYVTRLSNTIDLIWPGRTTQNPVPTKPEWLKHHIVQNVKQQVLRAEKDAQAITEIEIN